MRNYFKIEIHEMTELFVNNDPDQGCDPDTMQDCGIVETKNFYSIQEMESYLNQNYSNIEHFEDNRYETGYETLERDGTHVSHMVSIYITQVIEIDYIADQSLNFNK